MQSLPPLNAIATFSISYFEMACVITRTASSISVCKSSGQSDVSVFRSGVNNIDYPRGEGTSVWLITSTILGEREHCISVVNNIDYPRGVGTLMWLITSILS